ncbi:odorant receptor 30a-like [Osmia bicornis bicornis]|uniref:odorant receptor 30a-like n=1 Tax=Osmia bicornis bicornis TaxID=1437191 RepID=UPI001EAF7317|nr:odorant receptor 30a-like [Osmia bicornis bicornis]
MILTFHKVFDLLELAGKVTCTWPEDSNTSKWTNILRNFRWIFALINVVVLLVSLALGVYHHRRDFLLLMKTMSEVSATLDVFCDLILCKMNSTQLQILIQRIRKYLETAGEYENHVVQSYLDRYKEFYSVIVVAYIATGIFFTLAPLFLGQNLPADGWIPFSTESFGIYCIVYFVEAYCIWQAALIFVVDIMIVTLFCFTAARLDILGSKLKQVNCRELLVSCIKEHQEIIRFLEDTEDAVQFLLFKMNVTIGIAVVSATFPMLYNQSLAVTGQFLCMLVSVCARMYIVSWPADDLKESSLQFSISVNNIQWIGKSRKMTNIVLIMMQRSQKPFLVSMGGLFPALSLEYYSQFLTTMSSYFMAMRTMIEP